MEPEEEPISPKVAHQKKLNRKDLAAKRAKAQVLEDVGVSARRKVIALGGGKEKHQAIITMPNGNVYSRILDKNQTKITVGGKTIEIED